MSWWDYGYQIAGMANRTTLVDNNTWNNSHIALVRHFNATYRVNAPNSRTECVLVTFKTSFSSLLNKMPACSPNCHVVTREVLTRIIACVSLTLLSHAFEP